MPDTDDFDVREVMLQNEQKSGVIVRQRAELDSAKSLITHYKRENEALRKSIGVMRFRLWKRTVGGVIPKGEIVVEHSWTDESATYRSIIVRMSKSQPDDPG